jgi:hypothetical protein
MATNPFISFANSPQSPSQRLLAITPSDATDISFTVRQIYVGVGGDITVIDSAGNTVTHVGVPQGSYIGPFAVDRVKATGTTASSLVGYV